MAKGRAERAGGTTAPVLFSDAAKRRHLHLFLARLLKEEADRFPFDESEFAKACAVLRGWADLAERGHLQQRETQLDAEFLEKIFGDALGYRSISESPDNYQRQRQFQVPGAGLADGALGNFVSGKTVAPTAIIELKGPETDLDHDRFDGRTPVRQCWDYLNQLPDTPWGIVSNCLVIRLYYRGSPARAYEEFTVADFKDESRVRQFYYVFERHGLLGNKLTESRALKLLKGSTRQQTEVGEKLYKYYSEQRDLLIQTLIEQQKLAYDDAIHAAQRLLDRIIFMAFCEDRALLPPGLIEKTWAHVPPLARATNPRWKNFLEAFHAIDKGHPELELPTGYNGGLFEHDPLVDDLNLEDRWANVFNEIGKYDFREEGEINVDVLGHLFEKSITELEKKRVLGLYGLQRDDAPPMMPKSAERKRFGIYYTPPQFTRLIVDRTLGELIRQRVEPEPDPSKQLAALRALTVCDPACGSGAFLIAAYELLEQWYEHVIREMRKAGMSTDADRVQREYPDYILHENLYGVDLSKEAVEITQLALWIRSARKGRKLTDLSKNIVRGNSLVRDPNVHEQAFNWVDRFGQIFKSQRQGFDCVIGNPPWERMKLQEREFFALGAPEIASAVNAAQRRKLIAAMESKNPELWQRYQKAQAAASKTLDYSRSCGHFPLTGKGDVNTYMVFAELGRQLVSPTGRVGLLVPSGIATDDTTKEFFQELIHKKALVAIYDFENKLGLFAEVHRSFKFCVLVLGGSQVETDCADFVFFARDIDELDERDRHIELSERDLKLLNPNTRTCPIFRSRRDAQITKRIYRRVPILVDENRRAGGNPWGIKFATMFHQTNDAELFRSGKEMPDEGFRLEGNRWVNRKEVYLPLYEAKMVQAYDHRAASVVVEAGNWMRQGQPEDTTLVEHHNPEFVAMPRWWVGESEVLKVIKKVYPAGFVGFKDITSPTNQRTMIAAAIPWSAVTNHFPLLLMEARATMQMCLLANLNALAFDYVTRQKIGGITLNFFIVEQLPTLPPDRYAEKCPWSKRTTLEDWISERVLKLTCTAEDMVPLAEAANFTPRIWRWNEEERARLRAELDAAYFILYGIERDDVEYVLSTFQGIVKEDQAHGGVGMTRRLILDAYESMLG